MINEVKRIDKLDNIVRILANIDISYWKDKSARDAKEYSSRVASMMTNLSNKGLIDDNDEIYRISQIQDSTGKKVARSEKNSYGEAKASMAKALRGAKEFANILYGIEKDGGNDISLDRLYGKVFDYVNAWGGSALSRSMYGTDDIARRFRNTLLPRYKKGVRRLITHRDIPGALSDFRSIDGLDMSYATKHLWFWTEVLKDLGEIRSREPVFDDRIARALLGQADSRDTKDDNNAGETKRLKANNIWDQIVSLNNKLNGKKYDRRDVEEAVFNFLGTYFPIGNLENPADIKAGTTNDKNYKEAKALSKLRIGNYNVPGANNQGGGNDNQNDEPLGVAPINPREKTPEELEADRIAKEKSDKEAADKAAQYEKDKKEKSLYDRANAEVQSNTRKFERQAYEEIVPQNIRDILGAKVTASDNRKRKARAEKDALQGRQLEREKELKDKKIKELIAQYREEENQINENWNKWAKWATL